jgi:hypothetical protein
MSALKPVIEDKIYCSMACPFFEHIPSGETPETSTVALCNKDQQEIYFYDWFIAHCIEKTDGLSEVDRA